MAPIGVMDSGIGGLAVLREMQRQLPHEHLLYLADQAHLPYGPRSLEEIQGFTENIARYFMAQGVKLIVIACNTASAAALKHVRRVFPEMPFVGMEPAVRPAARDTRTGTIGVIATAATFQGELYASLIDRFAHDVNVITRACPEFVTLAERGAPWTPADYQQVQDILAGMRTAHADQLVIGCTHFTFLNPLIQQAMGAHVTIVDPAPAVARQVERVLRERDQLAGADQAGQTEYLTTGDPHVYQHQIHSLLGIEAPAVSQIYWQGDQLG